MRRYLLCLTAQALNFLTPSTPDLEGLSPYQPEINKHSSQGCHLPEKGRVRGCVCDLAWSSRAALSLVGSSFPKTLRDLDSPRQPDLKRVRPGGVVPAAGRSLVAPAAYRAGGSPRPHPSRPGPYEANPGRPVGERGGLAGRAGPRGGGTMGQFLVRHEGVP